MELDIKRKKEGEVEERKKEGRNETEWKRE